jgi:hypothetical protein
MFLPVFQGQQFSYSYEQSSNEYLLHDNDYKSHRFLSGKVAEFFQKQIEEYDTLPEPIYKTGLMIESLIKLYLYK